jgi:nitrogen PTS system EIIA component
MRIGDYLKKENCIMDLRAFSREAAIEEITESLVKTGLVKHQEAFIQDVLEREKLGSTGIGLKVAIPHAPTESVNEFVIGFGRSELGIDFQAIDDEKVHLVFVMGTNPQELGLYLKLLAELSRLLRKTDFREALMKAASPDEVVDIFKKYEA